MNNVNIETIEKFVEQIQNHPEEAKKKKKVTGSWVFEEGKPQFTATLEYPNGNVALNVELPVFAGGWGTSPDPIQYCLYGLGACFAVTFAATAANEGVNLTELQVTTENWMDLRKQMGVASDNIIEKVKFTINAAGAPRDVLENILTLTVERCPGAECITKNIPFEAELAVR